MIAEVAKSIDNDETPGIATTRPQRAAGHFAGLPMAQAALRFARARHAGQRREVDHAAFITHPIEVGSLLRRDAQPDEIIAAGLLHDVLEKTATTSAELHRRFGTQIAQRVESVSDDPSIGDYMPANGSCATASRTQTLARARSSQRTRSPKARRRAQAAIPTRDQRSSQRLINHERHQL